MRETTANVGTLCACLTVTDRTRLPLCFTQVCEVCLVCVCQLRIAKDNLRKSPTATPTLQNPWSGPENVSERDDGEIAMTEIPVDRGEDSVHEQQAWVGFLGGAEDGDEDRDEEGIERSWGAGLFGMVGHGRRDAGDD